MVPTNFSRNSTASYDVVVELCIGLLGVGDDFICLDFRMTDIYRSFGCWAGLCNTTAQSLVFEVNVAGTRDMDIFFNISLTRLDGL